MTATNLYPTPQHAAAAEAVVDIFAGSPGVDSVLLMGSCARGKASPDSCLDILVLGRPADLQEQRAALEARWEAAYPAQAAFAEMLAVGAFSHVDLEIVDGVFDPAAHHHGWTSGADAFELEIGNTLAYTMALWEGGSYYQELRARWLPYYGEDLRRERLEMVLRYCRNNLAHIPLYSRRGLHFQSFKRLHNAFEEFLQALFIAHRTYPIAYDKWVKEGVSEVLGLPGLYARLPGIFELHQFESLEMIEKADEIERLIQQYVVL